MGRHGILFRHLKMDLFWSLGILLTGLCLWSRHYPGEEQGGGTAWRKRRIWNSRWKSWACSFGSLKVTDTFLDDSRPVLQHQQQKCLCFVVENNEDHFMIQKSHREPQSKGTTSFLLASFLACSKQSFCFNSWSTHCHERWSQEEGVLPPCGVF